MTATTADVLGVTLTSPQRGMPCSCGSEACRQDLVDLAGDPRDGTRPGSPWRELRNRVVERHLTLAVQVARRFRRPSVPDEDLDQVAYLALVGAVDRFDPDRGLPLSAFAVPTMTGAIKRYFRDNRWMLRTPRRLKELHLQLCQAYEELTQRYVRSPTTAELARHVGCAEDEVIDTLRATDSQSPLSLDGKAGEGRDAPVLSDLVGETDRGFDHVEDVEVLGPALAKLPERQQRVVMLRFYGGLTQTEIGDRVGCSQMQVSRLLKAALRSSVHCSMSRTAVPRPTPSLKARNPPVQMSFRRARTRSGRLTVRCPPHPVPGAAQRAAPGVGFRCAIRTGGWPMHDQRTHPSQRAVVPCTVVARCP
ncbi:sigma-70 family RNA polymerase sigma factor [Luedemannella flava]